MDYERRRAMNNNDTELNLGKSKIFALERALQGQIQQKESVQRALSQSQAKCNLMEIENIRLKKELKEIAKDAYFKNSVAIDARLVSEL